MLNEEFEKNEIDRIKLEEVVVENLEQIEEIITPAVGSVLCCN